MTTFSPSPRTRRATVSSEPPLAGGRRSRVAPTDPVAVSALILTHGSFAGADRLGESLARHTPARSVLAADTNRPLPDPAGLAFAVLVGADVSLADVTWPWSPHLRDWLQAADATGTPVLAIGSGAELLALALGGGAEPAARSQYGFTRLKTDAPRLIAPGPWLAFSANTITLPPRARPLAHDETGPKAFRIGRHLGVHFHPQATPELVAQWLGSSRDGLQLDGLLAAAHQPWPSPEVASQRLFDGFLDSLG